MSVPPAVAANGVARRFGHRWILREISFEIAFGEAVLLFGSNGAGKTTLLRLLAGLLSPTRGTIDRHASVGMVAHESMLYDALSARENLRFAARLLGVDHRATVDALLERLGLAQAADASVATYSRGMVQRLAIARALLNDPRLLVLDEPLSNLDDAGTRHVRALFAELVEQGRALVIATHQLPEIVGLTGRVGYLLRGRLAALEPVRDRSAAAVIERFRELADAE